MQVPQNIAVLRTKLCAAQSGAAACSALGEAAQLTRLEHLFYKTNVFLYYWVLSTPLVGATACAELPGTVQLWTAESCWGEVTVGGAGVGQTWSVVTRG